MAYYFILISYVMKIIIQVGGGGGTIYMYIKWNLWYFINTINFCVFLEMMTISLVDGIPIIS